MFGFIRNLIGASPATPGDQPMLEVLENRCMLSASSLLSTDSLQDMLSSAAVHAKAKIKQVKAKFADVTGDFQGTAKFAGQEVGFTMNIVWQKKNKMRGTIEAAGLPAINFTGTVLQKGKLVGQWKAAGVVGHFKATLKADQIAGVAVVKMNGQAVKGSFSLDREIQTPTDELPQ